jgi:hypothetical protein
MARIYGIALSWTDFSSGEAVVALTHARERLWQMQTQRKTHMKMQKIEWKRQWGLEFTKARFPGVFRLKEGGYLVRARIKDQSTGKLRDIKKVLHDATEAEANQWLTEEKKTRAEGPNQLATLRKTPFATYALSVFDTKVDRKKLSVENQDKWKHTLIHLIEGVRLPDPKRGKKKTGDEPRTGKILTTGFGPLQVDAIRVKDIEAWQTQVYRLISKGHYTPNTANGWLRILKTIMRQARREYEIGHDAMASVQEFDDSEHETHTEEDPNSLTSEQTPTFLRLFLKFYPQLFAMTFFGFATGLRGTNISPIRRKGPKQDLNWETGVCYIRRSAGRLGGIRNTTKQKRRYRLTLPPSLMQVLVWHVETQLEDGPQKDSDYLFASLTGKPRIAVVLNKALKRISREMGLPFELTVHGMRRTFNSFSLAADTNNLVTRSISGHLTEKMQEEYTTVWAPKQQQAIASVIELMGAPAPISEAAPVDESYDYPEAAE